MHRTPIGARVRVMTEIQVKILELFGTLTPDEQRELTEHLSEQVAHGDFYDAMTPEQRARLREAMDQVDRGETVTSDELRAHMAERFKLTSS